MSGLPGDENPNPQWQRPSQDQPSWQSQWQQGSPLGDQAEQQESPWQQTPNQPNPQWQPTAPTQGKAITALILSIVGLVLCPYIFSVLGLIFGYISRGEIKRSGGALAGEGLALAAIIIGWGAIAVWTLFFAAVIAA
jgi:hypothetical protein